MNEGFRFHRKFLNENVFYTGFCFQVLDHAVNALRRSPVSCTHDQHIFTGNEDIAAFCRRAEAADFVTVDTEFLRERTFWPQLCLLQIAAPGEAAAIDTLAPGVDLSPAMALLADPDVLKVFHAARQDIEIFYHLSGKIPAPIFDTQVAAMVCGFGESVSYETLVAQIAKATIDKSARFTDWARRPLTKRQIEYALADVVHLRAISEALAERRGVVEGLLGLGLVEVRGAGGGGPTGTRTGRKNSASRTLTADVRPRIRVASSSSENAQP